jgi:hypothetical protein
VLAAVGVEPLLEVLARLVLAVQVAAVTVQHWLAQQQQQDWPTLAAVVAVAHAPARKTVQQAALVL